MILYFSNGIKPILIYLFNEMTENGNIKKNSNFFYEKKIHLKI